MKIKITLMAMGLLLIQGYAIAQNGIYGTLIGGQKLVNVDELNSSLDSDSLNVIFPSNLLTFGGEGHIVIAKKFVLYGKGFGFTNEKKVEGTNRRVRISGGMGIGGIGYSILPENNLGLKLIPQVGVGLSPFILQVKESLADDSLKSFDHVVSQMDDKMIVIQKGGAVLDACLSMDWYGSVIRLLKIIPGLETGFLIHGEIGYAYLPGNINWFRDVDKLADFHPDLKFDGMYFNIGIGVGLVSKN